MRACPARRALLWRAALLALPAVGVTGCAAPQVRTQGPTPAWSGRLALQVHGDATQSYAALFDLQGSTERGELTLTTPVGTALGRLAWNSEGATLDLPGTTRQQADSLEALVQRLTGGPLPVAALFDWLVGKPTPAEGWRLEPLDPDRGRIVAHRDLPLPQATLRIALSR